MNVSPRGIALIKQYEGFRAKPYRCPAGIATIGYGNTTYLDGRKVMLTDAPIDAAEATELLAGTLDPIADKLNALVTAGLTQGQFDALASFIYNIGWGAFAKSTLCRYARAGDWAKAAAEFDKWVHGGGKVLPGLVRRRAAERALFEGTA